MSEETKEKRFDDYSQDENVERHTRKNRWVSVDIGGKPWVILLFCFCQLFFRWFLVEIDNSWFAYHFSRARVFLVFPRIPFQKTVWKWKMNVSFVVFEQKESEFFFWTRLIRRRLRSNDWIGGVWSEKWNWWRSTRKKRWAFPKIFFFRNVRFFFFKASLAVLLRQQQQKAKKESIYFKKRKYNRHDWRLTTTHDFSLSLSLSLLKM